MSVTTTDARPRGPRGEAEPERVDKSRLSPWRSPAVAVHGPVPQASQTPSPPTGRLRWHARRRVCGSPTASAASSRSGRSAALPGCQGVRPTRERCFLAARAGCGPQTRETLFWGHFRRFCFILAQQPSTTCLSFYGVITRSPSQASFSAISINFSLSLYGSRKRILKIPTSPQH